jgi:hypothetical protein
MPVAFKEERCSFLIFYVKVKVKISLLQAVEAHGVARG